MSEPKQMKTYKLDRFRDGQKMAEGAKVEAESENEALEKARALFPDCPQDTFHIRLEEPGTASGHRDVQGPMELLPCPFCGSAASFMDCPRPQGFRELKAFCQDVDDCGAEVNEVLGPNATYTIQELIARWNQRAPSVPEEPKSEGVTGASSEKKYNMTLPCGCLADVDDPKGPVYWNEFNQVVQCHKCGQTYSPPVPPVISKSRRHWQ